MHKENSINLLARLSDFLLGDWKSLSENPISAEEVGATLARASIPSTSFFILMVVSAVVATLGLISNNPIIIVGAMITAPLMNPIISLAYSLIACQRQLFTRSLVTLCSGIAVAIAVSCLTSYLFGSRVVDSQILLRTEPNLTDLAIAIASGIAGGLAYARRSISTSLPGVAIAVALVPPLCVVGIALTIRGTPIVAPGLLFDTIDSAPQLAQGASLLFVTNLIAIVFCSGLVFLSQGYGTYNLTIGGLIAVLLSLIGLSIPLTRTSRTIYLERKVFNALVEFSEINNTIVGSEAFTDTLTVAVKESRDLIEVWIQFTLSEEEISQSELDRYQEYLTDVLQKAVHLRVQGFRYESLESFPSVPE